MEQIIIMIIIIALLLKNSMNQKEKKISMVSLAIIPALLIYSLLQTLEFAHSISFYYYVSFGLFTLLGIITGVIRSRFYIYRVLESGGVVYKRKITDVVILICYLSLEIIARFIFQNYEPSLFVLVNTSLLFFAAASITTRRFIMLLTYLKLSARKDNV